MSRVCLSLAYLLVLALPAHAQVVSQKKLPHHCITPNYYIETDVSQEFADDIGDFMEVLYSAYMKVFTNIEPNWSGRLRVRILKNRQDYIKEVGEKLSWSAGVYRGRYAGILTSLGKGTPATVKGILKHEGFHQFFDKFIGGGATWVNEGLATYFGSGILDGDKIRLGAVHARTLKSVRDAMEKGTALTLKDIVLITSSEWVENMDEKDRPPQYAQTMLLIHFLVHGYNGRNLPVLNKYLMLQKNGVYGEKALVQAFGTNFGLFEKKWKEYVLQLKPYEPASCTRNLERLGMLLQCALNSQSPPATIQDLYDKALTGQVTGWQVILPDGRIVKPTDAEEIAKWFQCPDAKKGQISYELLPSKSPEGFPSIVCRRHGKYLLRARIVPRPDGKGTSVQVEHERLASYKK